MNKELLLKDLSARLPYGVECLAGDAVVGKLVGIVPYAGEIYLYLRGVLTPYRLDEVKPYLRSMDTMTEEEEKEICQSMKDYNLLPGPDRAGVFCGEIVDWLNSHHFDYRGLIPMGLAIAVTEENSPYET